LEEGRKENSSCSWLDGAPSPILRNLFELRDEGGRKEIRFKCGQGLQRQPRLAVSWRRGRTNRCSKDGHVCRSAQGHGERGKKKKEKKGTLAITLLFIG